MACKIQNNSQLDIDEYIHSLVDFAKDRMGFQKYPDNHIGVLIENIEDLPQKGYRKEHRDGTVGVYVKDPYGNMVEYIWYSEEAKALVHKPH